MQTIRVNLAERSYDIEIGRGNLADLGRFLAERAETAHVVLITDENVHRLHAMRAAEFLGGREIETDVIVVPPGEESKSPEAALSLWQGLLDLGVDRRSVVAAVGGGVVGDLAGFVAATFARGLRLLQVPTTLLAQVDSSVGGKVGINLPEAKNIVGAFHQPVGVLIDVAALATLPEREYRAGLAEVVKYGAALDAEFFGFLEQNAGAIIQRNEDILIQVVTRCCRLKADIVERDEREESGLRASLNFGHTFGHAYEMISGQLPVVAKPQAARKVDSHVISESRLPDSRTPNLEHSLSNPQSLIPDPLLHGEAVSIGMVQSARLGERLGRVDSTYTARLRSLLETFGLPVEPPECDAQSVIDVMMNDKKNQDGRIRFILPHSMGLVQLVEDAPFSAVLDVLRTDRGVA
ncbi:MAG: 3-dehydroquinate synthase [Pirellulaceae bacterium]|nr:3-dehydroquinate synthase [Pirellulaceae bacterium]